MGILDTIKSVLGSAQVASAANISKLKVDGNAGPATIKLLEGYLGCPKTGVIPGQKESLMKKYAPNVTSVKYNNKKSLLVMKLQALVEFEPQYINGIWDNNLSYALQYHLAMWGYNPGALDGVFAKKSVKALQRFLNAQIPQPQPVPPQPTPEPSTIGDAVIAACQAVLATMKNTKYAWESKPTLQKIKKKATCVSFVAGVLQYLGYKKPGNYVWHNGRGYGTGKVTGATKRMDVMYMKNKLLKNCKNVIQKGDILLFDDNKSGESGNGGHIGIATGDWKGNDAYIYDMEPNRKCIKTQKPRTYSGNRKVLAIVRLK